MSLASILPELLKARDEVKDTIKKCEALIDKKKSTKDKNVQRAITESIENLKSLEHTLGKLDEKLKE